MRAFKLLPACKDYLWGGDRLRTDFHVHSDLHPLAEAWVLSAHPDGPSVLPDGTTLPDYLAANPSAAMVIRIRRCCPLSSRSLPEGAAGFPFPFICHRPFPNGINGQQGKPSPPIAI